MQRNVLFLMVDCMRADILSDRRRYPSLPSIDALLARSTSFGETITAATTTTPSVATMLTGRYPSEHGVRSLLGNNEPLVVIDGIPMNAPTVSQALSGLAPQSVARIDVLKDAGSTAAFGSRGANGVILVTTKR